MVVVVTLIKSNIHKIPTISSIFFVSTNKKKEASKLESDMLGSRMGRDALIHTASPVLTEPS